jgi:hypothetical protein
MRRGDVGPGHRIVGGRVAYSDEFLNDEGVAVYVPLGRLAASILPGSGVVGTPQEEGRVLVDYEGNRYGAVNMVTLADRVRQAWGRHARRYPTVARQLVRADELIHVGWFLPALGEIVLLAGEQETLARWLGSPSLDGAELVCSR